MRTPVPQINQMNKPVLFPPPKTVSLGDAALSLPGSITFHCEDESFLSGVRPWIKKLNFSRGSMEKSLLKIRKNKSQDPEGYILSITPDGISLEASSGKGVFRALSTLIQIINHAGDPSLPCLHIEDSPTLARRGFMLDSSRCKVLKMEEVFELIDLLASLGYNELQLYVEHTFAFKKHKTVWKDASPFTAEEIQKIDQYCSDRFIELVPNLNSFGHFERWLIHEEYQDMAECPNGFLRETPYMKRDHGTTLRPNEESLHFIDSLYAEYLPNFSSKKFNVGLDEPWELGQGWSQQEVEKIGKDRVYLRHLDGIRRLVEKHGRQMQFWADVLLEKPENAKLLCPTASPIIWGYEPEHPFDEQARVVAECGLSFCLAPGVATWRSLCGRWQVARKNLTNACKNAQKHGAEGMLITSWGDCGNHQPWPTLYPGLFHGAALSWTGKELEEQEVAVAIDRMVYSTPSAGMGNWLIELGKIDEQIGAHMPNTSLDWWILFAARADLLRDALPKQVRTHQIRTGLDAISEAKKSVPHANNNPVLEQSIEELSWGLDVSEICLTQGMRILKSSHNEAPIETTPLLERFQRNWLKRARPGGLKEASTLLTEALAALAEE